MNFSRSPAIAAAVAAIFVARTAQAEGYAVTGAVDLSSGGEGGGGGATIFRRAGTTLRAGGEVVNEESPKDVFSAAALFSVEPHAAIGADARYGRRLGEKVVFSAGGVGWLFPRTLFGASADVSFQFPLSKVTLLAVTPTVNGYFLGNDLPDDTVLLQAILRVGVRVKL